MRWDTHYGEILYNSGQNFTNYIELNDEQRRFGEQTLPVCEQYAPKIMEEIKGLSDGTHTPYELMATWLMTMYGFGNIHGCTCFCYHDRDKIYLARNSDMFPELKKTSESALYIPEDGNIFLGNTTSFVQMEDGMNDKGLAAGINFLMTRNYRPGLNTGFLIRLILDNCSTVREAIELIRNVPICSTQNIILADQSGALAVAETSPDRVCIREATDHLVSSNHFVTDEMQNEHANPERNWYMSEDRYKTADDAMNNSDKDLAFAQKLLSGGLGFICQYPKSLNFDTLWSSLYDVSDLKIYRAEGNPCKTKFKEDTRLVWGISRQ